jgi:hypothetical protein
MRSRAGSAALAVSIGALVAAASGQAAGIGPPIVKLLPTGPSPASIAISAGGPILFQKTAPEGDSHIVFGNTSCWLVYSQITESPCELTVPSGGWIDANGQIRPYSNIANGFWDVGSFSYRVEGFGAGTGTVIVKPTGLIQALEPTVTFGAKAHLSGVISTDTGSVPPSIGAPPSFPEEGVTVMARPYGREDFEPVAATVTRGGFWRATTRPRIETTYRIYYVEAGSFAFAQRSEDIVEHVRPRVTIRQLGAQSFFTHVRALATHTGKHVKVQRLAGGNWQTIEAVRLSYHSSARFRLSGLPRGSEIRVLLPASEAGPGYLAGVSRALRSA